MPTCINADTQYAPVNSGCSECDMPQVATQEPQNSAFLGGSNAAKNKSLEAILLEIQQLLRKIVTTMSILATEAENMSALKEMEDLRDALERNKDANSKTLDAAIVSSALKIAGGLIGIGAGYGTGIGAAWGAAAGAVPGGLDGIASGASGGITQKATLEQMYAGVLDELRKKAGEMATQQGQERQKLINTLYDQLS